MKLSWLPDMLIDRILLHIQCATPSSLTRDRAFRCLLYLLLSLCLLLCLLLFLFFSLLLLLPIRCILWSCCESIRCACAAFDVCEEIGGGGAEVERTLESDHTDLETHGHAAHHSTSQHIAYPSHMS